MFYSTKEIAVLRFNVIQLEYMKWDPQYRRLKRSWVETLTPKQINMLSAELLLIIATIENGSIQTPGNIEGGVREEAEGGREI